MEGVAKPSTSSGSGVTVRASVAAASIEERFADLCKVRVLTCPGVCAAPFLTFRWVLDFCFSLRKACPFLTGDVFQLLRVCLLSGEKHGRLKV
jgi:hypothetical protein